MNKIRSFVSEWCSGQYEFRFCIGQSVWPTCSREAAEEGGRGQLFEPRSGERQ